MRQEGDAPKISSHLAGGPKSLCSPSGGATRPLSKASPRPQIELQILAGKWSPGNLAYQSPRRSVLRRGPQGSLGRRWFLTSPHWPISQRRMDDDLCRVVINGHLDFLCRCDLLKRTPSPPPLSSMNWMPASSNARRIEASFAS